MVLTPDRARVGEARSRTSFASSVFRNAETSNTVGRRLRVVSINSRPSSPVTFHWCPIRTAGQSHRPPSNAKSTCCASALLPPNSASLLSTRRPVVENRPTARSVCAGPPFACMTSACRASRSFGAGVSFASRASAAHEGDERAEPSAVRVMACRSLRRLLRNTWTEMLSRASPPLSPPPAAFQGVSTQTTCRPMVSTSDR